MKTLRYLLLLILTVSLLLTVGVVVFLVKLLYYALVDGLGGVNRYLWTVLIGLDQLGGSILYNEPDWTISSRTYHYAHIDPSITDLDRYLARLFESFIDLLFGRGHCMNSYNHEYELHKRELREEDECSQY